MRYEIKNDMPDEKIDGEDEAAASDDQVDGKQINVVESEDNVYKLEFGNAMAQFTDIRLLDAQERLISCLRPGQKVILEMRVKTGNVVDSPIFGFVIKDRLGNELVVTNTAIDNWKVPALDKDKEYIFQWRFTFPEIHADEYPVDVALANGTYQVHDQVHFVSDALVIKCVDSRPFQEGRGRYILKDAEFVQLSR